MQKLTQGGGVVLRLVAAALHLLECNARRTPRVQKLADRAAAKACASVCARE
jgi:hypothetical protein